MFSITELNFFCFSSFFSLLEISQTMKSVNPPNSFKSSFLSFLIPSKEIFDLNRLIIL